MTTLTFTMELRGEMVAVSCEVYRSRGQWCFEEEIVVGHPDWDLNKQELDAIQRSALSIKEYADADA